jgi:hypothetical protein
LDVSADDSEMSLLVEAAFFIALDYDRKFTLTPDIRGNKTRRVYAPAS